MPNKNLELPNQPTLASGQEPEAARQLGSEQAQARNGNVPENEPQGDTLEQQQSAARIAQEKEASAKTSAGEEGALDAKLNPTTKLLQGAERILITPGFALGFAWINIHVWFLNRIFGEKLFCNLGKEWAPTDPSLAASLGLGEKILLIILDVVALVALLVAAYVILEIVRKLYPLLKVYLWFAQFS
ncbi:MAG: hypothetical protein PHE24_01050 [Patescibacteria group bacterium]|nr:hypothetical protein [Patescibacteria group bacterium]